MPHYDDFDVLAMPTMKSPASADQARAARGKHRVDDALFSIENTMIFNMLGLPALTVPCGFSSEGLPIGVMICGPRFSEGRLLALAAAYEHSTPWHERLPPEQHSAHTRATTPRDLNKKERSVNRREYLLATLSAAALAPAMNALAEAIAPPSVTSVDERNVQEGWKVERSTLVVDGLDPSALNEKYLEMLKAGGVNCWHQSLGGIASFANLLSFCDELPTLIPAGSVREIRQIHAQGKIAHLSGWQSADPLLIGCEWARRAWAICACTVNWGCGSAASPTTIRIFSGAVAWTRTCPSPGPAIVMSKKFTSKKSCWICAVTR